ncbi:hypothetical protein PG984_012602 [Apiospora sp. TS-2023a]
MCLHFTLPTYLLAAAEPDLVLHDNCRRVVVEPTTACPPDDLSPHAHQARDRTSVQRQASDKVRAIFK